MKVSVDHFSGDTSITLRHTEANNFKEAAEKLNVGIAKDITNLDIREKEKAPYVTSIAVELLDQKEYEKLNRQYYFIEKDYFCLTRIPEKILKERGKTV